jgi:hypothetical protein
MRVKPPQHIKWRVDLSSVPSGLDNPATLETDQSSFRDSAKIRSGSHFASTQRPQLFQESTSSIPGDESAKSSEQRRSQDHSSDEELIIHEEVLGSASLDSFLTPRLGYADLM